MFTFVCCDVTDGGEYVSRVCSSSFDTITMVDSSFACFVIDVKELKVIVEIDGSSAEISSEEGGMSSENRCDVDSTFSAERECYSGEPFVEMCNDSFVSLVRNKLKLAWLECWRYLSQEPSYQVAKNNGFICFLVSNRCRYSCNTPQICFPLIQATPYTSSVKQQHPRSTLNEPSAIQEFDATRLHRFYRLLQRLGGRIKCFDFN